MTEEEAADIILTGMREVACPHCKWPENVIYCQHCLNMGFIDNEEYWDACEFLGEDKVPDADRILFTIMRGQWRNREPEKKDADESDKADG